MEPSNDEDRSPAVLTKDGELTGFVFVWGVYSIFLGILGGYLAGNTGNIVGFAAGIATGGLYLTRRYLGRLTLPKSEADPLAAAVAAILDGGTVTGVQAAGTRSGQAVRFWTEAGSELGGVEVHLSVRAPRNEAYLHTVTAQDLGVQPFAGPGELVVRVGGARAVWSLDGRPTPEACREWVESILRDVSARLAPEDGRTARLIELVEDGKPSAFEALVAESPDHPRLSELADALRQRPEPGARLAGARWVGNEALDSLIDDLTFEPVWQARALRARAEAAELKADAVQRWSGVPALRLELLIAQVRRGPLDSLDGLVDSAPSWTKADDARLEALANVIIDRGPDVESATRRLFDTQPAGRRHLARALGEIGGMPSLATLRAASEAVGWPQFDDDEAAVERAITRITHRLGDAAAGMLALDDEPAPAGGLTVAGQTEHE